VALPVNQPVATPITGTPVLQPVTGPRTVIVSGAAGPSTLPFTGDDTALIAQLALLTVVAGAAAARAGRRRTQLV